jgi:ribonuclease Z
VAREAGVRMLALTHVSTRYFGHQVVEEARELFPATEVPRDFDVIEIPFPERGSPELIRAGAQARRGVSGTIDADTAGSVAVAGEAESDVGRTRSAIESLTDSDDRND